MREVFFKRFLLGGFYVKREGDSYWLGHYFNNRKSTERMRISKQTFQNLLRERPKLRAVQ